MSPIGSGPIGSSPIGGPSRRNVVPDAMAVETMVNWFNDNFEAPDTTTRWDDNATWNDTKEPDYKFGGPFRAREVLTQNFFEEFSEVSISAAVEQIESAGVVEWAPSSDGKFWQPHEASGGPAIGSLKAVLSAIEKFDKQLDDTPTFNRSIGDNGPPPDVGIPPYSLEDRDFFKAQIAEMKAAIAAPQVNHITIVNNMEAIEKRSKTFTEWLLSKGDLAVDEGIKQVMSLIKYQILAGLITTLAATVYAYARSMMG